MQPVVTLPRPRLRSWPASIGVRARERLGTTPGRLVLLSGLLIAGIVCFGALATAAERARAGAARNARIESEPLVVQAANLYSTLADANATAATTFLTGGVEPAARRGEYLTDVRQAANSLSALTGNVRGSAPARAAVRAITEELPVYSGLVEAARANNLQGFPVGAAYLRRASTLLTSSMLPRARELFTVESTQLSDDYASGRSASPLLVLLLAAAMSLALLVLTQLYVARTSRRILNPPLVLATISIAGASAWALLGLASEHRALGDARKHGSDLVEVLSGTKVLLSRAQSDESLTLANRGSDESDPVDFQLVLRALAPPGGLIATAAALDNEAGTGTSAAKVTRAFDAYRASANKIMSLQKAGEFTTAIHVATAAGTSAAAARLDANLNARLSAAQRSFARASTDAESSLSGLSLAIPLLTLLAVALTLVGVRQRLEEYR